MGKKEKNVIIGYESTHKRILIEKFKKAIAAITSCKGSRWQ